MKTIVARAANRIFVGPVLCESIVLLLFTLMTDSVCGQAKILTGSKFASSLLRMQPKMLCSLVFSLHSYDRESPFYVSDCIDLNIDIHCSIVFYFAGSKVAQRNCDGLKLLKPFIDARRNGGGTEEFVRRTLPIALEISPLSKQNDFLTWLINEGEGEDIEDLSLAVRTLGLNFAAIQTTSRVNLPPNHHENKYLLLIQAVAHALFDLASNPEYLKPLREEVEEATEREGWTKAALDQMCKLDSFVKESQRLRPTSVCKSVLDSNSKFPLILSLIFEVSMGRYTLLDFTFLDGTFIPAGTVISVHSDGVHLDPQTYEDPLRFDGFRFIKMKERAVLQDYPDKNFEVVTINSGFVAFGQGKHACPGRFFASAEMKLMFAHIVTTYDVKLVDGVRPPDSYYMNGIQPNPTGKVYFRKRQ
jgi:hypothetical protein